MTEKFEKFQILPHRADLRIRVWGRSREEIFENFLRSLNNFLVPKAKKQKAQRKIKVSSSDKQALLVDFLNEVLFLMEFHKEFYEGVRFDELKEKSLKASLWGYRADGFENQIKAATYHNVKFSKTKTGFWEAEVLFDV